MTGKEIVSKAIILLGYNDSLGNTTDARFQVIAKNALNFVYADLFYRMNSDGFEEIKSLSEKVKLPEKFLFDCMPYGVAAFIAESIGDGEKQQYFSAVYNLKRSSAVGDGNVSDAVPAP